MRKNETLEIKFPGGERDYLVPFDLLRFTQVPEGLTGGGNKRTEDEIYGAGAIYEQPRETSLNNSSRRFEDAFSINRRVLITFLLFISPMMRWSAASNNFLFFNN